MTANADFGRRATDREGVVALLSQFEERLEVQIRTGFSKLNDRMDHLHNRVAEHEKKDDSRFDSVLGGLRVLQDARGREIAAKEATERVLVEMQKEQKERSDRNMKVIGVVMTGASMLSGLVSVVVTKFL